jgi:chromosome partitioning protein
MAIIVVGSSKGGCGKSTLCTNLTVQQLLEEPDTLLVDSDPQKSSSNWSGVRESKNGLTPALVMEKTGGDLAKSVLKMAEKYPSIYTAVQNSLNLETSPLY